MKEAGAIATGNNQHWTPALIEWCAEAYLKTDYGVLTPHLFTGAVQDFAVHLLRTGPVGDSAKSPTKLPPVADWSPFRLGDLGRFVKGERLRAEDMEPGPIPFVGATEYSNGIVCYCAKRKDHTVHPAGSITISYNGSIGCAFYQDRDFMASDDINVLYPSVKDRLSWLFICTVIGREKFRFSYGRKWHLERMAESVIFLPATQDNAPDYALMSRYIEGCGFSMLLK